MTLKDFNDLKIRAHAQRFETSAGRLARLQKLQKWIKENQPRIEEALFNDFAKPRFETQITEIMVCLSELKYFCENLKSWMKDKEVPTPVTLMGHESFIRFENKGVVLIISPWNYPFQLTVMPLIAALAAGNTVVIKPSEVTVHCSALLAEMCAACFAADEVTVKIGGREVSEDLLALPFHHVFFTGSTAVGRAIALACAARLIPYTLELGGKSPVILDETANLDEAVKKIFWGKFLNRGQICVAPDTVFVHAAVKDKFLKKFATLAEQSRNFESANIISDRHAARLTALTHSKTDFRQTPCALIDVTNSKTSHSELLAHEIFGPVAPVIGFNSLDEVESFYKSHPNPLALYVFSKDQHFIDRVIRSFPSGGVGINTLIFQLANHHLPFGGIGESGHGRYHGYFGFLEFSHQRAVIEQKSMRFMSGLVFPPYTPFKTKILESLKKLIT